MATFSKVNDFVKNMNEVVNMSADTIALAFSNTAPSSETSNPTADTNGILGNVTQISYANWTDDLTVDRVLTAGNKSSAQTGGTYTFDYTADIVITASGGPIATFRYIYLWDDTPTSPVDPLCNVWDHGSGISLADSDSATIQFNASGIYTVT